MGMINELADNKYFSVPLTVCCWNAISFVQRKKKNTFCLKICNEKNTKASFQTM